MLAPVLRGRFGLSLVQVALLPQLLNWAALVVEPVAGVLIDVRSRRLLLAWGAAWLAVATLLLGIAPVYGVVVLGFVAYGLGSGPLAHTADVVLVESFPDDGERVFARATVADTVGALLGPLLLAAAFAASVSWRVPLIAAGIAATVYAVSIAGTAWPPPARLTRTSLLSEIRANVSAVWHSREARRWLLFLFLLDVFEAPSVLRYVWLNEDVGLSAGEVALYAAAEQILALAALVLLDRLLARFPWHHVLTAACVALTAVTPLWLHAPGTAATIGLGMVLAAAAAVPWPIGKARSLRSVPASAGAVSAVTSLFALAPLTLAVGAAGRVVGLPTAMLVTMVAAAVGMIVVTRHVRG